MRFTVLVFLEVEYRNWHFPLRKSIQVHLKLLRHVLCHDLRDLVMPEAEVDDGQLLTLLVGEGRGLDDG